MKILSYILFLFSLFTYGQQAFKIDSLISKSEKTTNFNTKGNINLQISKLLENKNRDSSKVFAKNAIKSALQIKNNLLLSKAYLQLGILFYKQNYHCTPSEYVKSKKLE